MNKIRLKIGLSLLGILLATGIISAQQGDENAVKIKTAAGSLTGQQIEAIKAIREERAAFRNAFRETLTGNQLDILTKTGLSRQERLRNFRASLSADQLRMIKTHRKMLRIQNNTIRATVAEQQRIGVRRMAQNRNQQNRTYFQRIRMKNKHMGI
jgi:hypothetical protein